MNLETKPLVGCVVLTYGPRDLYVPLVEQLTAEGVSAEDIVVVHNPSLDGEQIEPPVDPVVVIEMAGNMGYAGGMNAGIRNRLERGCSHVLLLTQDTRFRDGGLRALLAAATREHGIIGPVIQWDSITTCFGGVNTGHGGVTLRTALKAGAGGMDIVDCDWVEGSAMLVRREVFDELGLLDERFFMYFEETELCLRASRAGWRIGVLPRAVIVQDHGGVRRPELHAYLMTRNGLEFARQAAGPIGVVAGIGRTIGQGWRLFRTMAGRRADRALRRRALASLIATGRGLGAFVAHRFGPPPASLLREWE